MFNDSTSKKPRPFCKLTEIRFLDADRQTPEAYHGRPDFDSHHIFFSYADRRYHLYTFEPGTDLFWRLRHAVENAKRISDESRPPRRELDSGCVRLIKVAGKEVPEHLHYGRVFAEISARIAHVTRHDERMKALADPAEISLDYFPTRRLFFESALVNYLTHTLVFLSDSHLIPAQVKSHRLEQVQLIAAVLKQFSFFLEGAATAHEGLQLIQYNHACHFKALLRAMLQTEWYILSQPRRASFLLHDVQDDAGAYFDCLQEIEGITVTLCFELYLLGVMAWRKLNSKVDKDLFLNVLRQEEALFVHGAFHTVVFMLVQMCHVMPELKPIGRGFCQSLLHHLWLIDYAATNIEAAAVMLRNEFIPEFDVIVTEKRFRDCLNPAKEKPQGRKKRGAMAEPEQNEVPPEEVAFSLYQDMISALRSIQAIIHKKPLRGQELLSQFNFGENVNNQELSSGILPASGSKGDQ
jgi:hypothetical protein